MRILKIFLPVLLIFLLLSSNRTTTQTHDQFILLLSSDALERNDAFAYVDANWQEPFIAIALEIADLSMDPATGQRLVELLESKTGMHFGQDLNAWYEWLWNRDQQILPDYGDFKARLYGHVDSRFEAFFKDRTKMASIRLDEVRWAGVVEEDIPPLRNPKMIRAKDAAYLDDDDIVFGIELHGDARAYPERILAWHEMFTDEIGGIPVVGAYCSLSGSIIIYNTKNDETNYDFGISGFLHRSNMLMYDRQTMSLWYSLWGKPVIGPLAEKNIALESMSVVTTTWKEWRKRHPDTKVLSNVTGYFRDYREGVANQDYFSTDELLFTVPQLDRSLNNKDEILAIRVPGFEDEPLAISIQFLQKHPVYQDRVGNIDFVVLTDKSGGNRVYATGGISFKTYDQKDKVTDSKGIKWVIYEHKLVSESGEELFRVPYHRAFWFGWYAAYPKTRLVKYDPKTVGGNGSCHGPTECAATESL